jgi:PadR family transcriptional regulator, regulatory protein PadR
MALIQQFRKGSTPVLILSVLQDQPKYGYQIMRELEQRSQGYFSMTAALLYPALHSLEEDQLVVSEWRGDPGRRQRKYYQITEKGRQTLKIHLSEWGTFMKNLFQVAGSDGQVS